LKTLVVVSGGDAPGINTALYHFAGLAAATGDVVIGAQGGFPGVLRQDFVTLSLDQLIPWAAMPGSFLASSRDPVLAQPGSQTALRDILARHTIDNLLLFGGDGTLRHIPPLLAQWGIPSVGIPTTIDNDVPGTDQTLGFDSACNFAYPLIDGIRATGHALVGRVFTLETLGGGTGFLALEIAGASGADAVLVPEIPYDPTHVSNRLQSAAERKGQALLVYSEGLPDKLDMLESIGRLTGIRVRSSHLGHAQRGGTPSHADRKLAADMAHMAYTHLRSRSAGGVLLVQAGHLRLHSGALDTSEPKPIDRMRYTQINGLTNP
jgi:6-phosphofructokinase 1